jgi:hypothetical protein
MKKPIVLFERNCHVTEKAETMACARRCRSSRFNKVVDPKRIIGNKMEGKGGEAQGVTGQKNEFALGQKNGQIAKSRDSTVTLFEFFSCESRHLQMTAADENVCEDPGFGSPPHKLKITKNQTLCPLHFIGVLVIYKKRATVL